LNAPCKRVQANVSIFGNWFVCQFGVMVMLVYG